MMNFYEKNTNYSRYSTTTGNISFFVKKPPNWNKILSRFSRTEIIQLKKNVNDIIKSIIKDYEKDVIREVETSGKIPYNLNWQPISENWKKKKGNSKIWYHTGNLISSFEITSHSSAYSFYFIGQFTGERKDGFPNLLLGKILEYGSSSINIPPRPLLEPVWKEGKYEDKIRSVLVNFVYQWFESLDKLGYDKRDLQTRAFREYKKFLSQQSYAYEKIHGRPKRKRKEIFRKEKYTTEDIKAISEKGMSITTKGKVKEKLTELKITKKITKKLTKELIKIYKLKREKLFEKLGEKSFEKLKIRKKIFSKALEKARLIKSLVGKKIKVSELVSEHFERKKSKKKLKLKKEEYRKRLIELESKSYSKLSESEKRELEKISKYLYR